MAVFTRARIAAGWRLHHVYRRCSGCPEETPKVAKQQQQQQQENVAGKKTKKQPRLAKQELVLAPFYREHMSPRRLARVLRRDPCLSSVSVPSDTEKLARLSAVLREHVKQEKVGTILSWNPRIVELEPEVLAERIKAYKTIEGLEGETLSRFFSRREGVLSTETYNNLISKIKYFQDIGIPSSYILRQLMNYGLLQLDLEKDIKPKLEFFIKAGLEGKKLGPALHYRQFMRDMKLENLEWAGSEFQRLGLGYKNLLRVVGWNHKVLLDGNLAKVEGKLAERGLKCGTTAFAKAVMTYLHVRDESFTGVLEVLEKYGISPEEAFSMFVKIPSLASYSQIGVEKKMQFLTQEMGVAASEVVAKPSILQASIEKKALPRLKFLEFLKSEGLLSKVYSPSTILNDSEATFKKRLPRPEVYAAIRAGDVPALTATPVAV